MTLLSTYTVPGLKIEDHSVSVPLNWHDEYDGSTIRVFYRIVSAIEHASEDMPFLLFLQGGPGGMGPRPMSVHDGWVAQAAKHYRIVLLDQRGTGRSTPIDGHTMEAIESLGAHAQAQYLKHFLADSIIRDCEYIRTHEFGGKRWTTLGQSYGGFLTLTYLSLFPEGLQASFVTGGIAHVPADAREVYEHTFPRMQSKTQQFYERYPEDAKCITLIADALANEPVALDNGDMLTVERLQTLGSDFGMKPSFERLHWLLDTALRESDGSASEQRATHTHDLLTCQFLTGVAQATATSPLYWPLQEFIYANGELDKPIEWAAAQVYASMPQFATSARPLLFTGEAIFPWMFEQERALRPFAAAMDMLMQDTHFGTIYDADQLARNEVPLNAAVYYDDMYVDAHLQLDTLNRVGNSHAWVTNEFEHDGLRTADVFERLYTQALERGDLQRR